MISDFAFLFFFLSFQLTDRWDSFNLFFLYYIYRKRTHDLGREWTMYCGLSGATDRIRQLSAAGMACAGFFWCSGG